MTPAGLSSRRRKPEPSGSLAALRRRHDRQEAPYAVYRIALQLPARALGSRLSRAHPGLRIEVENRMELGPDLLLLELRVYGPGAAERAEEIRNVPGVMGVEVQEEGPETAMYRIAQRTPMVQKVAREHRVLARYPITLKNGWLRFETVAKPAHVRALLRDLSRRVGPSHVEAVRRGPVLARNLGLTPAQDALFRAALTAGYFRAPRGISVSDLAEKVGRSKSSTSEMPSKIQRRLAESALLLELAPLFAAP
jgi:hypothetical protein